MNRPAKLILPVAIVCSFCDNDQSKVAHIIAGKPGIAICDECVAVCTQTIVIETRRARGLKTNLGGNA